MKIFATIALIFALVGCGGYNTQPIKVDAMTADSPARQLADGDGVVQTQIDPVFSTGLVEDEFIRSGNYQVVLARMSDAMINDLRWYSYAGHQGVAYDSVTGKSYPVQWLYHGIDGVPVIDQVTGHDISPFPCDRYVRVFIEGMDTINMNAYVLIGNVRGNKFFDLKGNEVPFDPKEYVAGNWKKVESLGTKLSDMKSFTYEGDDLRVIKSGVVNWSVTGRYPIEDITSGKITYLLTPYQHKDCDKEDKECVNGLDIIKELVRLNPNYSLEDKIRTVSRGISMPISPNPIDYASVGLAAMIAGIQIPLLEEGMSKTLEDNVKLIARLRGEVNSCSAQQRVIPVPVQKEDVSRRIVEGE